MIATEVTRRIAAPLDVVWSTITDVGRYPERVRSYVHVEYLTPERSGVGASWRQTRTVFGREHSQQLRIVGWEPPGYLKTAARESGAVYTTRYRLTDANGSTEVTVLFEVSATNVIGAIIQRLLGARLLGSTREAMERDLADLATAAEASDDR
jgi:hypothetical protein